MGKLDREQALASRFVPLPAFLEQQPLIGKWLIPQLLLAEGLVLVSGPKKRARKTYTSMQIAVALAAGKPVGLWTPTEARPVLFVEEEGPLDDTQDRIRAVCKSLDVDPTKLETLGFAHHKRVKLDTNTWRDNLVSDVQTAGAKLLVLDAIVYMHNANENSTNEMQRVVDTLRHIRSLGCTVMYLAHTDKMRGSDRTADIDDQVRGTGLLTDCYDTHIALRQYKVSDPLAMTLRWRDHGEESYIVEWDYDVTAGRVVQADMRVLTTEQLNQAASERCLTRMVVGMRYAAPRLRQLWGLNEKRSRELIASFVEAGAVVEDAGGYTRRATT